MSAQNTGRQSPSPEESSNAQTGQTSNAQGVNDSSDNQQKSKDQLANLESNPKPQVLDQHAEDTVSKKDGVTKG